MSLLFDLSGKVVLATGATRGIGRAITLRMAEARARVVVSSRKQDAGDETAAAIVAYNVSASPAGAFATGQTFLMEGGYAVMGP